MRLAKPYCSSITSPYIQQRITIRDTQYALRDTQYTVFERLNHRDAVQIVKYAICWGQHVIPDTQVLHIMDHCDEESGDSLQFNSLMDKTCYMNGST